jgi:hypothetical protein
VGGRVLEPAQLNSKKKERRKNMKKALFAALTVSTVFWCIRAKCAGQKKGTLVLLPFTGGNGTDGVSIVSSLARQKVLRDMFDNILPVGREQRVHPV